MDPLILGTKYDKIAEWWRKQHFDSEYGVQQVERALGYRSPDSTSALDVGCGAGGRFVRRMVDVGLHVTGLDVSQEMIKLARESHPEQTFQVQDICTWETEESFDFILAWDSIFHLPFEKQESVVAKLCGLLTKGGILIYTFGDAVGEHDDAWHDDTFHYSSIGIEGNLRILAENGVECRHLELDQYPQPHVYLIGRKS